MKLGSVGRRGLASAGAVAFLLGLGPQPQAAARPADTQTQVFQARAEGVLVDVEVTRGGYPVGGLKPSDFELRDEGVPQTFEMLASADAPINAVLALDVSASTQGARLADLVAASRLLIDGLRPGDHVGLTTFNEHVTPPVPLTTDFDVVRSALERLTPAGDTALLDGVYAGLLSTQRAVGASLVVAYTDGADTASWLQPDEVLDAAKRLDAVLDAVVVKSSHQWTGLKEVIRMTGGEAFEINSTSGLSGQFARILRNFRSRYQLTFVPRNVPVGGFHRLEVSVRGSGLTVHSRAGYFSDLKHP